MRDEANLTDETETGEIQITLLNNGSDGASVEFHYDLKDMFRKVFKNAKWDSGNQRWTVGNRSVNRLKTWVDEMNASGLPHKIAMSDRVDLTERQVEKLRDMIKGKANEIEREQKATADLQAEVENLKKTKDQLNEIKDELQKAKDDRKALEAEERKARQEVNEIVEGVVSISEIEELRMRMRQAWKSPTSKNRDLFNASKEDLIEIRDILEENKIESDGIDLAISANYNRKDRDYDDLLVKLDFSVIEVD
ncbi:hypothetical protein ACEWPM_019370 [Roseovarius sp. S4756]|uniref:hypothetical protein n=1 Tax=Roseovarius maritimus TaxID=3342637 RepID=UPI00372B7838